ncbi:uncharacterized protein LOC142765973 [Rhipicephalus microplus]|uniref:uncharacterized protein LOC142765973 n=1 Tax=Rhipicephalus microplus TaxID=6941 RepID=UPI003F6BDB19
MSTQHRIFALYSTASLLTMLVEKVTCPDGNQGPPRERFPQNPSRFPTVPTRGLGDVSHQGVRRLAGGMVELPATVPDQSLQYPQPLGPIPGPSRRLSPIPGPSGALLPLSPTPGPSGHRSPPIAGGPLIARPGSPLRFGGIRISPPSSPLTLDSVVIGGSLSPPRLSHLHGPRGSPPRLSNFPGPSGSPPRLSHFAAPSGQSSSLAPEVVFPGPGWSPPPLSPVAGPSGRSPGLAPEVVFPGPSWYILLKLKGRIIDRLGKRTKSAVVAMDVKTTLDDVILCAVLRDLQDTHDDLTVWTAVGSPAPQQDSLQKVVDHTDYLNSRGLIGAPEKTELLPFKIEDGGRPATVGIPEQHHW